MEVDRRAPFVDCSIESTCLLHLLLTSLVLVNLVSPIFHFYFPDFLAFFSYLSCYQSSFIFPLSFYFQAIFFFFSASVSILLVGSYVWQ